MNFVKKKLKYSIIQKLINYLKKIINFNGFH